MITTFYPPFNFGGDGIFVERLSRELAHRGHHVDVIHCEDSYRALARGGAVREHRDHPGVVVHRLKSAFGALSPLATHQTGYPLFKSRRIREILATGFDVINYHNISLVGGPAVLKLGTGIKLYTLHEYWLVCPTHILFKFNRAPCVAKQCALCCLSYRRPPQWWRATGLMKSAVRHVDAFICPDRFTAAKQREMGLDLPVVHIPHFVPRAESHPGLSAAPAADRGRAHFGDLLEAPYFLFVGRLEPTGRARSRGASVPGSCGMPVGSIPTRPARWRRRFPIPWSRRSRSSCATWGGGGRSPFRPRWTFGTACPS
jgi:glycosyltransferase involved in cell wall biosynthesis